MSEASSYSKVDRPNGCSSLNLLRTMSRNESFIQCGYLISAFTMENRIVEGDTRCVAGRRLSDQTRSASKRMRPSGR